MASDPWKYRGKDVAVKVIVDYITRVLKKDLTDGHIRAMGHWLKVGPRQYRLDADVTPGADGQKIVRDVQRWMARFALRLKPIQGEKLSDGGTPHIPPPGGQPGPPGPGDAA